MRIIHVTDREFPPQPDQGGAPQSLASLVTAQSESGHEVRVATVADDSADGVARLGRRECWDRHLLQLIQSFRADVVHFHALGAELQPGVSSRGFASVAHVRGTHVGYPVDTSNAIYVSQRHAALHGGITGSMSTLSPFSSIRLTPSCFSARYGVRKRARIRPWLLPDGRDGR
jgi:hypothetical protein